MPRCSISNVFKKLAENPPHAADFGGKWGIYIYIHVYIPMYIFLRECVTIRYSSRFLSISPPERSCNMLDKLVEEHVYLYVYSNIARKCAYTYVYVL